MSGQLVDELISIISLGETSHLEEVKDVDLLIGRPVGPVPLRGSGEDHPDQEDI